MVSNYSNQIVHLFVGVCTVSRFGTVLLCINKYMKFKNIFDNFSYVEENVVFSLNLF